MRRIEADKVRYIKLGAKNAWARDALARGEIPFGDAADRFDLAEAGDWDTLVAHYRVVKNATLGKARDFAREVRDFYTLGSGCLWISFSDGKLWWCFAAPEVILRTELGMTAGKCFRRAIDGWSDKDIQGRVLRIGDLSGRLTKVAAYRQTLCDVKEREYLLRRLNAEDDPQVKQVREAKAALISAVDLLITRLHPSDFELLTDLIFTRGGWRRVSVLGRTQADIDLALEQPTTRERAFVQVKSSANQAAYDDYLARFEADGTYDRFYFVCHSPTEAISSGARPRAHVWSGAALAEVAVDAGLIDWLIEKNA